MNIVKFCAFLVLSAIPLVYSLRSDINLQSNIVAKVIHDIVEIEDSTNLMISADTTCSIVKEILNEFATLNKIDSRPVEINTIKFFLKDDTHILLFCSTNNFLQWNNEIGAMILFKPQKTLIYCPDLSIEFVSSLIDKVSNFHNFYLVENKDNIQIVRILKYSKPYCKRALSIVNTFEKNSKIWIVKNQKSMFEIQTDFKACNITFGIDKNSILSTRKTISLNHEILMTLERKYNFNADIKIINERENIPINQLNILSLTVKTSSMLKFDETSFPLENIQQFYLVSNNNKKFVNSEKIFLVFDSETWILILISIIVPILSIQIINCFSERVQNFVYGGKAATPTLNVLAIWFGVRQTPHSRFLPQRSSSRIIFTLFIFYTLIIRTCYQKLSFEFLTHDIYANSFNSIYDFIFNNYSFIALSIDYVPRDIQQIANLIIVHPQTFVDIITKECKNETAKFVIMMNSLLEAQIKHLLYECSWIKLMNHVEDSLVLSVPQMDEFSGLTVKTVDNLRDAGILNLNIKKVFSNEGSFNRRVNFPKVLSLDDLCFYFKFWSVSLLFPLIAFIFEIIIYKSRNQSRIRNKYGEQNNFECVDFPTNADEIQDEIETQDSEKEEENVKDVPETQEISSSSLDTENVIVDDSLHVIKENTVVNDSKDDYEEEEVKDGLEKDTPTNEEDEPIEPDNSTSVND